MRQSFTPTEEQKAKAKEQKILLSTLSRSLKADVDSGKYANINEALKAHYAKEGHTDLKTLYEWNAAGYLVKKGMTALKLWGKQKTGKPKDGGDDYTFFPVFYCFSRLQVTPRKTGNNELSNASVNAPVMQDEKETDFIPAPVGIINPVDDLPF